jgi:predicted transcriptional regulator
VETVMARGPDPTVTDDELIQSIEATGHPFATTSDIAEDVSLSRQRINERLNRLHSQGDVKKTTVGSKAVVWWIPKD